MATLSLLDLGFVVFENNTTPLHISGLMIVSPPAEQSDYAAHLHQSMLRGGPVQSPFDRVLDLGLTHLPRWQAAKYVDLSYHIRRSSLPEPGDHYQLLELVSRIHSYVLDRSRPLWEVWIIDGLKDGKVAVLFKLHHSLADGVRASKLFMRSCQTDPTQTEFVPFWATTEQPDVTERQQHKQALLQSLLNPDLWLKQSKASLGLLKLCSGFLRVNAGSGLGLKMPFTAPHTPFNLSPERARRVTLVSLPQHRFNQIAKLTGVTMNDVVLTVCDMALHRYLQAHNWKEQKPLVALMPLNLRHGAGNETGVTNKMTLGLVEMGRSDDPPLRRLHSVRNSTEGIKYQALELHPDAYYQYAILVNALSLLSGRLGLNHYLPPATNMLISNVPGVKETLYFCGAKVEDVYPLSLLLPGQTLNITLLSYAGHLNFGFVCCRRSLPGFDVIGQYLKESLAALEQATLSEVAKVVRQKAVEFPVE